MRFSQTIILAVLAVTSIASPILPRWDQDWQNYENCCDQRDNHGQHQLNCQRPPKWEDQWHNMNDNDPNKWCQAGHKEWRQCHNDWKNQYNNWQQAKDKYCNNNNQGQWDHEQSEWNSEQQQWQNEKNQWETGNHWKPPHPSDWNLDYQGWHHYTEAVVLKCSIGAVIFKDYGGSGQPAAPCSPDKWGWYHFKEEIYIKCSATVVYKYYAS